MPCYRCGTRQTEPAQDSGAWRRGVRGDEQVLLCPDCQRTSAWADEFDHCESCGSMGLIRRLGRTVCGDRGQTLDPSRQVAVAVRRCPDGDPPSQAPVDALSRDVAAAIDRVLGRSAT